MPRQPARASSGRYVSRLTGGTLAVIMAGDKTNNGAGTAVTFSGLARGLFNVQVRRVMSTGTTCSNIVALTD